MSRLGKIPVSVAKDIKVTIAPGRVHLEGPKGKMDLTIPENIVVEFKDGIITVTRSEDTKQARSNHGMVRSRLLNNVEGVVKGHRKDLELQGVGFRASMQGKKVSFNIGFSHPVEFEVPEGVKVTVPTQTSVIIEGPDNVLVGQVASKLRALKPAEPYKGKGFRYVGEVIRRKQGKSVKK